MKHLLSLLFAPKPKPRNIFKAKKLNISHTVHPTRPFKLVQDFPVNSAQL